MPTKYTGRVLLILAVLYIALCAIFPRAPLSVFLPMTDNPPSWGHNLRPGIDMVGGTSLIYEIEATEHATTTRGLAEQVAGSLKKRVDPQGVRNLIWRPQGDTRLEIQMPLTGDSRAAERIREQYLVAQRDLMDLNVPPGQVIRIVEGMEDPERQEQLDRLASGSEQRQRIFAEVAAAYDELQRAQESGSIPAIQAAQEVYAQARLRIEATNLDLEQVHVALDAQPVIREQRLNELALLNTDFPERQRALEAYIQAYQEYQQVRDAIADTTSLKRLLQGSGVLSFHILADDLPPQEYLEWQNRLMTQGARPRAGDPMRWLEVERQEAVQGRGVELGPDGKRYVLAWTTRDRSMDEATGEWGLSSAFPDQDQRGARAVGFAFDTMGGRLFSDLTGANVGRALAVVLDGKVISAPTINQRIGGRGIITGGEGGFSEAEAAYLINTLNAGSLPARLSDDPILERTIGPQLGEDNLRAGFIVCAVGLVVVLAFLWIYYFTAGLVAFAAVVANILMILGAMAAMNATFTLPSVAGIILAVGMSVDANILIFERLREEQVRGLSLRMALRNAYDRAFSAIIDANITTGIVAAVLYGFGSEEVAGFGLTLLIGIFASLFTALFMTKTIFGIMIDKFGKSDLGALPRTYPAIHRALEPRFDWMSKAGVFGMCSSAVILIGLVFFAMAWRAGNVLDIEFAGGTTAQFELREPMPIDQVRQRLSAPEPGDPLFGSLVVSVESTLGQRDTVYEVVVANDDQQAVTAAIIERLGERLNIREASVFGGHDRPFEQVLGEAAFPIEGTMETIDGLPVDRDLLAAHIGGVAIVLRDLQPMLTAQQLSERFNQQRLKGVYNAEGLRGSVQVDVEVFEAEQTAVLLVSNDRYAFDPADSEIVAQWRRDFAAPAWQLIGDAVARPDELQKVTNVGAQVAAEFQRDAAIALILSLLGITLYIWVRFGDLISGMAAVVALAHDALFCIAGIGFAHLLAGTFFGNALMLEPFRINLTMVAAILTVMGFSINDTVVVFDRIRENRGKYGKLTRGVINDAINQTFSRTVLTSLTTIVTILVMYIWGGPGIHGFTFALLIGILTGTYSSIAVASPLLLLGRAGEPAPAATPAPA